MPQDEYRLENLMDIPDKITLDDLTKLVYTMILERREQSAEFAKQNAEQNAEFAKYSAEFAKQNAEFAKQSAEHNAEFARYSAEFAKEHDKLTKELAELKEASKRTDAQIKRTGKQLGDLHNKFGRMEEIHMLPSVTKLLNQNGYDFRERATYRNYILEDNDNKTLTEIDAVIDNCATTALLEVKTSRVKVKDIEQHIRRMQLFRADYERRGIPVKELIGVVAGVEFADDAKQAAIEAGFFVVVPDGKRIKFDVPEGFKAKRY